MVKFIVNHACPTKHVELQECPPHMRKRWALAARTFHVQYGKILQGKLNGSSVEGQSLLLVIIIKIRTFVTKRDCHFFYPVGARFVRKDVILSKMSISTLVVHHVLAAVPEVVLREKVTRALNVSSCFATTFHVYAANHTTTNIVVGAITGCIVVAHIVPLACHALYDPMIMY